MPLVANVSGVAASGTLVKVFSLNCRGIGPCRMFVKNTGADNALTAAQVKVGPFSTSDHLAVLDTTAFASLAADGGSATLVIPAPVDLLELYVTCAGGTELDIVVSSGILP